ncbi:isochorismate synthase MenF [Geminocystis sp. NIES-3709]|uniref:isochorismate synthase n=1 Tax=Geminocystis sp. NIES-3709 TaxID=1617448 RepID=UPI00130E772E|nr:isochorismate synthase [Geminocystis sp. NIES-3709]
MKNQHSYRFLSISIEIKNVDPLVVLQAIIPTHQTFFYLENQQQQLTVLGFDVAQISVGKGDQRFSQGRDFIQDCLSNTLIIGCNHLPFSGPHFFCNFTYTPSEIPQIWHNTVFPDATILFPQWQVIRSSGLSLVSRNGTAPSSHHCLLVANLEIEPSKLTLHDRIEKIIEQVTEKLRELEKFSYQSVILAQPSLKELQGKYVIPLKDYKRGVERAVRAISANQFQKIVLANAIDIKITRPFQIASSLQILRHTYPECYLFAVRHGGTATFLGATPEVLLRTNDGKLITEAMAGSAPRGNTKIIDVEIANRLLQSDKERYEHLVVVDFIVDCLEKLGLIPQVIKTLSLRQLSNIQHLWTPIYANLPNNLHPLDIVAQLHPTPAMAGIPRNQVLTKLQDYEPFDRLLYAAPLGWVNAQGNSEFVMGIRSALIEDNQARLYAGAGIVAGSNPEQELAEVQLKFRTLLNTLV